MKNKKSALLPALIILIILFLILVGGVTWVAARKPLVIKQLIETNVSTIVKEILPVSEFTSLVYNYQTITERTYNPGSWLNSRNLLIVLDGTIKLGFDCAGITIRESENQLLLIMPPIKIMAHEQYPERARSYDLAGGGLFPRAITPQEILDLLGDTKLDQEKHVLENTELLRQARDSAEAMFRPLLEMNPSVRGQYEIIFRWQ